MSKTRRAISFVLALALTASSGTALAYLFLVADRFKIWMPASAAILFVVGLFWLYEDFINATPND